MLVLKKLQPSEVIKDALEELQDKPLEQLKAIYDAAWEAGCMTIVNALKPLLIQALKDAGLASDI